MGQRIRYLAAIVLAGTLAGCGVSPAPAPSPTPPSPAGPSAPPGWRLTFADEFDGPAGAPPDPARWHPDRGGTGWGNQELQYYTPESNAFLDGAGDLVLEARAQSSHACWYGSCQYTSSKLTTYGGQGVLFSQRYGHFEIRARMPAGAGLLPAFWLLGDNIGDVGYPESGEIDVVETLGDQPGEVEQHAHAPGLDYGDGSAFPAGGSITDWHTYAVTWSPDGIDWEVDGQTTRTLTKNDAGARWNFARPFYLLLSLAVGGHWPGAPAPGTRFPARMIIDYVRVYQHQ